ncbi:hypothetical protein DO97_20385 [Neosynechococcus sphagnicola sy1]|uniref:Fimbrial assembly protein n=1 Tax=Neosynechococcus sphagnicola sy1 TaxID=1497020 RepID=A0A098TM95_9CYAN|nr:PilN domain-containing protein [Neosynechococcus sphagnicola]KGF73429.1 hypothetical protein DO97_20385 [Neosynechococcus sphagnicola sy1]
MYGLDINFLSDRLERPEASGGIIRAVNPESPVPLIAGIATGVLLPVVVGGLWLLLQNQNSNLEQQQAELDNQLKNLTTQLKDVAAIRSQISQVTGDTDALVGIFNQIKPWSALLQDIRDRTPPGIQIAAVKQTEPPPVPVVSTPSPSPSASPKAAAAGAPATPAAATPAAPATPAPPPPPPPIANLEISGVARSFSDINDFILILQQSPFLQTGTTRLIKADLIDNPTQVDLSKAPLATGAIVKMPKVVAYTIQTSLSDVPASELISELNRNGAVGLVSRIETLKTKGVIKP